MQVHPVIDQTIQLQPLDPLGALLFALVFVLTTLMTIRRPAYGLAVLIVVQPFAMYADAFHSTITLAKVALLAVLLGLFVHRRAAAALTNNVGRTFLVAGGLVLGAIALSAWHAQHPSETLREGLKMAEYLLLFAAAFACYQRDPDIRLIKFALAAVTIIVCIAALSQEILGAPSGLWLNGHPVPRIAGPLEGPNQLAGYLDISLGLILAFALEFGGMFNAILLVAVLVDTLTLSRGGAIGAAVALVVVFLAYRRSLKPLAFIGAGIASGLLVALGWALASQPSPHAETTTASALLRVGAFSESNYSGGVGSRSELWHAAVRLWRAHPLLGIGAGNFAPELPQAGLKEIRTHANSLYLQALVEGGLPLLAGVLWLTWTTIITFVRDRAQSPLIAGALAASVALAVHQVADFLTFYPKVGGWWWIVLALGAAEIARVNALKKTSACA